MCLCASPPLTHLSVGPREASQSHPGHVEQSDLPIVVRKSDDFLVRRHADPEQDEHQHVTEALTQAAPRNVVEGITQKIILKYSV